MCFQFTTAAMEAFRTVSSLAVQSTSCDEATFSYTQVPDRGDTVSKGWLTEKGKHMDAKSILIWIAIGIIAGWLASVIVGGGGLIRYLLTGLLGAFVGGFIFKFAGIELNLGNAYVNEIVVAAIGAIVVVLIARVLS